MLSSIEQCFCMHSAHFSRRLYYSTPPWWGSTTFSKVEDVCQARLWRLLLLLQLLHLVLHHDALPTNVIFQLGWWSATMCIWQYIFIELGTWGWTWRKMMDNLVIFSPGRPIRKIHGNHWRKTTLTWWQCNDQNTSHDCLFYCDCLHDQVAYNT